MERTVALLFVINVVCCAYKVAIFVPDIANSQIIWNVRVAETLTNAGHHVTLIRVQFLPFKMVQLPIRNDIDVWTYRTNNVDSTEDEEINRRMADIFEDIPVGSKKFIELASMIGGSVVGTCEALVQNKELLTRLREAKFDVAFADMPTLCSVGLIHYAKIPGWIYMNNGPLIDPIANFAGVPSPPSYVPPVMMPFATEMTFFERTVSLMIWTFFPIFYEKMCADKQTAIFRKHIDPNFPDLLRLAQEVPIIMVNSDHFVAYPRPMLHKIVYIGGVGMNEKAAKPLTGEFAEIANRSSNIVVFSFGSVANSSQMPVSWKNALMAAFGKFPEVQFIMRYVGDDLEDKKPANVHTSKWIPQTDLLHDKRTRALISHGGYNSVQEAINSGTPIIAIPLYGDQPANARLAQWHRFGIVLRKKDVTEETLTATIREILSNDMYAKSVERLRRMIARKPNKAEDQLIRWTEFVAEFGSLPNLTPHAVYLSPFVYHSLDVIAFLLAILCVILAVVFFSARACFRFVVRKYHCWFREEKKKTA